MNFISHNGYGLHLDTGVVIGLRGRPIGKMRGGYVCIQRNKECWSAHRMIWEAANGPIPSGLQINHINGIKTDNRLENLELVTPSENTKHAYRLGLLDANGENNGRYKGKRRNGQ